VLARVRAGFSGMPVLIGLALAAIARRPLAVVSQVTALALGLCALLVMAFVQGELVHQWQSQIPADAPDRFIINIQPDQAAAVADRLRAQGVSDVHLYPMIRGRLVSLNGRPMDTSRLDGERARALVEREFNLSYASQAPGHNRIVEGRWLAPESEELSIEEGIARTLGVRLGDRLCFDVAGQSVCAVASSVRRLSWDSMKVNFFVITSPQLLQDQPQTYITSVFVPAQGPDPTARLTREFRNLTVIDTTQIVTQIRTLIGRISNAVQFIVLFAVSAGVLVLYTTVSNSQDERMREAALLRALGASRRRLWTLQFIELAAIGSCAGALAGAGADAIGWWLARRVLDFDFQPGLVSLIAGVAAGIVCAVAGGAWTLQRVVTTPPMRALREA
jgi:putative ABC transport system permease protein